MPEGLKGGFPTYWTDFGNGPREALLIHCTLGHTGAWKGMAAGLSDLLHMTAFDLPGHGRSGDWDDRGPLQRITTDMAAEFLKWPMDVIGHSFGATVALRLATEHPDLVRSLVLIEPVFFAVAYADDPAARDRHDAELAGYAEALEAGDLMTAARVFSDVWGDGRDWDSLPENLRKKMAQTIGMIDAAAPEIIEDAPGLLHSGALEDLAMPVLVIEGEKTPEVARLVAAGLNRRIGNCRVETVAGAGHMAPITHPDVVAAMIRDFLENEAVGDQPFAAERN
ncbi:alpha/beta fold hydrolase [Thalassovita mangrovi]|uniref:Alpha/beta fold hydrolase n=1 Tax=Thalassovita mangrovi TaxID=2692236 RepID=A0A6L8LMV5_9RHOB|nr:alpha/beta hydrolase [Thalassovita mangrovi]MYM54972.1 alpha/beta fold hydrolase [Thalassovita mangrovi]